MLCWLLTLQPTPTPARFGAGWQVGKLSLPIPQQVRNRLPEHWWVSKGLPAAAPYSYAVANVLYGTSATRIAGAVVASPGLAPSRIVP